MYVDGRDVALLRATIVDAKGNPVLDATDKVTFAIKSGPGFLAGVGNGDPACQEPNQVTLQFGVYVFSVCVCYGGDNKGR
eukprot:COSAG05_NODE_414_length_10051_cov_120.012158_10_plen_80_part_00